MWKIVDLEDREIERHAELQTFRGEKVHLIDWFPPRHAGSSGKVLVAGPTIGEREFFPQVCGLNIIWEDNGESALDADEG
jgi:hypothetical protein